MKDTIKSTRNTKKRTCAIPAEAPAIPLNPKSPAITASMKNVKAQDNMIIMWLVFLLKGVRGALLDPCQVRPWGVDRRNMRGEEFQSAVCIDNIAK